MDCISFVYDYQLNIREISELGQGMRFSCFSSPLLGLGLDATLPIKSALFSMIQKPRDTSIDAILHTSIHFYAPLYTSIFISLRLMPPAFAGLEIASSMARSTTKSSSSNNSTILSIASSMARSTTKSNSNSSNNQQQQ